MTFDRNDPPGIGAFLAKEDRFEVLHEAAKEEVRRSPYLLNKHYGVEISEKDWIEMTDNMVLNEAILDGIAFERAESLEAAYASEDDPREYR